MRTFLKSLFPIAIFAFVLALITSCAKDEEVMTGTINGFVSDYTNANAPIAGATVTLNSKGLTKTTGSDGRFEFSGLEPGTYSIAVSANNYQPTTKQVTVYAGQVANCDFQLETGKIDVEFSSVNIVFAKDAEQASFSIKNNSNKQLNYSITDYPDYIQVSPSTGTVTAKGTQAISLKLINRKTITEKKNGQLTVNIGNDSYIISFSVEPYQEEKISIDINPTNLNFDKDTEQLTFIITSNYSRDLTYTIKSNLDILTVEPSSGTLSAHGQSSVSVTVKDRKSVDSARKGQLTIDIEGNTYIVNVNVEKYEQSSNPSGDGNLTNIVPNGLYGCFPFEDEIKDCTETELTAVGVKTSFVESFNGSKALKIPANSEAKLSFPEGLIDEPQMSISFWVKDLYDGHIFHAVNSDGNRPSFLLAMVDGQLKFVVTQYNIGYQFSNQKSFTHNSLEGWHMITLVSDFNKTSYSQVTTRLYVDGKYIDVVIEDDNVFGESEGGSGQKNYRHCTKFILGGELNENYGPKLNATSIVIDNLRIYKYRMLSDEEVNTIYEKEKR